MISRRLQDILEAAFRTKKEETPAVGELFHHHMASWYSKFQ